MASMIRPVYLFCFLFFSFAFSTLSAQIEGQQYEGTTVFSLDGEWQVAIEKEEGLEPEEYSSTVQVPGPLNMAKPKLAKEFFVTRSMNEEAPKYVWYRKEFDLLPYDIRQNGTLYIGGARYTAEVYLNGVELGRHIGGYTPFELPASGAYHVQGKNVLTVRLGDWRTLPDSSPSKGVNPEIPAMPSLWDNVKLIFHDGPRAKNIRINPLVKEGKVKISLELSNPYDREVEAEISALITDMEKNTELSDSFKKSAKLPARGSMDIQFELSGEKLKTWTPDHPNLHFLKTSVRYEDRLGDEQFTRFGYRTFGIQGDRFTLNGEPIYLSGVNIAFQRSFEDASMWDKSWIQNVIVDIPKSHNINFFDIHQGPPIKAWLDASDENGIMVMMTWPWWGKSKKYTPKPEHDEIVREWKEWVYGSYNHPSIVIWDPINADGGEKNNKGEYVLYPLTESPEESKKLHESAKKLDPNRPWGVWDFFNMHPYSAMGELNRLEKYLPRWVPGSYNRIWPDDKGSVPVLNDEYGINYSLTVSNDPEYNKDCVQRQGEFWRRYGVAGVAPFCYFSRTNGTFLSQGKPKSYMEEMKWAFANLGVSIDVTNVNYKPGDTFSVPVHVFNDTMEDVEVDLTCRLGDFEKVFTEKMKSGARLIKTVEFVAPKKVGSYQIEAETRIKGQDKKIGYSAYPADVLTPPSPTNAKGKVVIFAADSTLAEFLKAQGFDCVVSNNLEIDNAKLVILGSKSLSDKKAQQILSDKQSELDNYLKGGGSLLILNPDIRGTLPITSSLSIKRHRDRGGPYQQFAAHWLTLEDKDHPVFKNLTRNNFLFWNGALFGKMQEGENHMLTGKKVDRKVLLKWDDQSMMAEWKIEGYPGKVLSTQLWFDDRLAETQNQVKTEGHGVLLQPDPAAKTTIQNMVEYLLQ